MPQSAPSRRASGRRPRPPAAGLLALTILLCAGPIGLALSHPNRVSVRTPTRTLDALARDAGCRLTEYDADPHSNPPVMATVTFRCSARIGVVETITREDLKPVA